MPKAKIVYVFEDYDWENTQSYLSDQRLDFEEVSQDDLDTLHKHWSLLSLPKCAAKAFLVVQYDDSVPQGVTQVVATLKERAEAKARKDAERAEKARIKALEKSRKTAEARRKQFEALKKEFGA